MRACNKQTIGLPPFVEAMMRPGFYPEVPDRVELRQTHVSYVFLAGDNVYKVKKAVRFPFLDCVDVGKRYSLCADEVRLNSRLSPDVYLGVFPIFKEGNSFVLGPKAEEAQRDAVEYAVKMRRLPKDRMLDRLILRGLVDASAIRLLAEHIARFHASIPSSRAKAYGSAASVSDSVTAEISENNGFVGQTLLHEQLDTMERFFRSFISSHWELLEKRARDGFVREGHGDLRAEHICLTNDRVEVIDCVEFSERLRYADVASEIAFLAMDFERLRVPQLAEQLVVTYGELTHDRDLPLLLPFYKCYRASIRGKVESLRSLQEEVGDEGREQARELARHYFALAYSYARSSAPALIIVCGLSGTGKSTWARIVQRRTGFEIMNSDVIRKRLAGVSPYQHVASGYRSGIYTNEISRLTYEALLREAEHTLRANRGVILDATFKRSVDRLEALSIGKELDIPVLVVECVASREEAIRRLNVRAARAAEEVSDADVEVYEFQRREFESITEVQSRNHLVIDTEHEQEHLLSEIEAALEHLHNDNRVQSTTRAGSG
jgi:aminoglycoside phosphotransferase family enzyme/predicted kinase